MSNSSALRSANAEMTAYIAIILTRNFFDPKHIAQAGGTLRGWAIPASEESEYLLKHTLSLASPIGRHTYALVKPLDAYREHFTSGQYDDCFDEIFQSYLGFVEWCSEVSTKRAWFSPPPKHSHILNLLSEIGYLETDGNEMNWTDLAGHAMLCACAWSHDLRSHEEVREWQREKEARQIARSLPSDLVFLAMNNPGAAFWSVHKRLEDDA